MSPENKAQPERIVISQEDLDRFFTKGNPLKLMDRILEIVVELKTQQLTEVEKTHLAKKLIEAVNPVFIKELVVAIEQPDLETVTVLVDKASAHCYFTDQKQLTNIKQYAIKNLLKYLKNLHVESIIGDLSQRQLLITLFIYGQNFIDCVLVIEAENQNERQLYQLRMDSLAEEIEQISKHNKEQRQQAFEQFAGQLLVFLAGESKN